MDYKIEKDEAGEVVRVFRDEQEIPLANDSQEFCDFITWAVTQPVELVGDYATHIRAAYFSDRERLVEHLKNAGTLLAVDAYGKLLTRGFNTGQKQSEVPNGSKFCGLLSVVSHDSIDFETEQDHMPRIIVTKTLSDRIELEYDDEGSPFYRLSARTIRRAFVYIDISDFSTYQPMQQALVLRSLILQRQLTHRASGI